MKKRVLSFILVCIMLAGCARIQDSKNISLFFVKADGSEVCEETRAIALDSDASKEELLEVTIKELLKGPSQNSSMKAVIPKNTELLNSYIDGTVAHVDFSEHFNDGKDSDRLLRRYTLISTLCAISGIKKVKIQVEGKDIMGADGPLPALGIEDFTSLNPEDQNQKMLVTLYFLNDNAMPVTEKVNVSIKENETAEAVIVNKIISGPETEGLYPTVASGTKLLDISVKEGVCFVNLSSSFVSNNSASSLQSRAAVYSIVNSLCELPYIDKVQFLIEGESKETFGNLIFKEPFTPEYQW